MSLMNIARLGEVLEVPLAELFKTASMLEEHFSSGIEEAR